MYCQQILLFVSLAINNSNCAYRKNSDTSENLVCQMADSCNHDHIGKTWTLASEKNCLCDSCARFNDCCQDVALIVSTKSPDIHKCNVKSHNGQQATYAHSIVKCDKKWPHSEFEMRQKCEIDFDGDLNISMPLLTQLPVFGLQTNRTYQNIYCFQCNFETLSDAKLFAIKVHNNRQKKRISHDVHLENCFNISNQEPCLFSFDMSEKKFPVRKCLRSIDTCADALSNTTVELRELCMNHTAYRYSLDVNHKQIVFKNKYCAMCNGFTGHLGCRRPQSAIATNRNALVYDLLIMFNVSGLDIKYSVKYRESGSVAYNDNCMNKTHTTLSSYVCNRIPVLTNTTEIGKVGNTVDELSRSYLTLIGQLISILSLIILLVIYVVCKSLRTMLAGKLIMCLAVSLLFAQATFCLPALLPKRILYANMGFDGVTICNTLAILSHFFHLAYFAWSNAVAFDLFKIFTFFRLSNPQIRSSTNALWTYSIYAWSTPLCIVLIKLLLNYFLRKDFSYGSLNTTCFLSDNFDLLVFFTIPVGVILLLNIVLFLLSIKSIRRVDKTSRKLLRKSNDTTSGAMFNKSSRRNMSSMDSTKSRLSAQPNPAQMDSTPKTQRNDSSRLALFMKLFCLMGINWITGLLSSFHRLTFLWYIHIITNSLQGFLIFVIFLFTHQTMTELKKRISCCWAK
jgi:hypothetical protein